jgi:photosystem II stability/assembly factor-like uncharacterized protein
MGIETGKLALFVSTKKGFWCLRGDADRRSWSVEGPAFLGHIVNHTLLDPRDRHSLLVAARTGHPGPTIFCSSDLGKSFQEASRPPAFPKQEGGRAVHHVFCLQPGHASQPGVWYAGTSPEGLFRTEDGGDTWAPVSGLHEHPRFPDWTLLEEGDGTPDGPILHSIAIDPRDPQHMYVAMSGGGGGVFETSDGSDWRLLNAGCLANFSPDPYPEFGLDPHCLQLHPQAPDVLWQQNHCGIYRLERPGERWERVGDNMPPDVGDIGFPIALHPRDPDTAWVFPMDGTDVWPRISPGGRPAVYATRDAGRSWRRCARGLPSDQAWYTVLRQGMSTDAHDPLGVYLGVTCGEVWGGLDEGEAWSCVASHLPFVLAVEAAELG